MGQVGNEKSWDEVIANAETTTEVVSTVETDETTECDGECGGCSCAETKTEVTE